MINIYSYINNARKAGNKVGLSAYQNILAELQKYETSRDAELLTEAKQLEIINKYAKSLEDSILQFQKANRDDLVAQYTSELEVVKELLPRPATAQEINNFIEGDTDFFDPYYVTEYFQSGDTDYSRMKIALPKKDMGKAIKYIKSKFPTADGKMISDIIKSYVV